jgi:UDP-N-acetylglucosamine--N-acetylmuramyl-(pentapeptide) pyrophosphoryl-undecaprenol N-acetylglucosamine transferase
MPTMLAAADLVVCRAGATTVAELCVIGLPAVLVPLPGAPRDHQTLNARRLADAGAAVLVADDELDGDRLREVVGGLLGDRASLGVMAAASLGIGRPDAAELVAELLAGMMAGRAAPREGGDSG